MSNFIYCNDGAENCAQAAFKDGGCWLTSAGEKPKEIEKMIGGQVEEFDKLYVKFEGRESLRRGQYGHLGQYSCEIWGEKLISAERIMTGPPEEAE